MRVAQFTVLAAAAQLSAAATTYNLVDNYTPANFFDKFDFNSQPDLSNGFVSYQTRTAAFQQGLVKKLPNSVRIGVNSKDKVTVGGRKSVRVETKTKYKHGLIIADIKHMPSSVCGVWPAFWTVGDTWPKDGELDIIEGVNRQSVNKMALHTTKGCKINKTGAFTGLVETTDCDVYSPTQAHNQGCLVTSRQANSYGTNFNTKNGGVYAIEWGSFSISVWFFPRGSIPANVMSKNPDPLRWGKPVARFSGNCQIDKFMQRQRLIFNTNFCGDWAKAVWNQDSVCRAKGPSCETYVKNNPKDFTEAYWEIYGMKIYKKVTTTTPKPK